MVSAEASPFASTGGLGDVLQGLPKALAKQGHDVAVALPLYPRVRDFIPQVILHSLRFASGNRPFKADIAQVERAGVHYFFLDLPALFDRPGIYGEAEIDYPDNTFRYAASAVVACHCPECIHAVYYSLPRLADWHPASTPARTLPFTTGFNGAENSFHDP